MRAKVRLLRLLLCVSIFLYGEMAGMEHTWHNTAWRWLEGHMRRLRPLFRGRCWVLLELSIFSLQCRAFVNTVGYFEAQVDLTIWPFALGCCVSPSPCTIKSRSRRRRHGHQVTVSPESGPCGRSLSVRTLLSARMSRGHCSLAPVVYVQMPF